MLIPSFLVVCLEVVNYFEPKIKIRHDEEYIFDFFEKFPMISKIIFRHGKQYFVFKLSGLAYKKTPEMKELAPNKQTLKIWTHNSQKQKS